VHDETNAVFVFRKLEEADADQIAVNQTKAELETKLRNLE